MKRPSLLFTALLLSWAACSSLVALPVSETTENGPEGDAQSVTAAGRGLLQVPPLLKPHPLL